MRELWAKFVSIWIEIASVCVKMDFPNWRRQISSFFAVNPFGNEFCCLLQDVWHLKKYCSRILGCGVVRYEYVRAEWKIWFSVSDSVEITPNYWLQRNCKIIEKGFILKLISLEQLHEHWSWIYSYLIYMIERYQLRS